MTERQSVTLFVVIMAVLAVFNALMARQGVADPAVHPDPTVRAYDAGR